MLSLRISTGERSTKMEMELSGRNSRKRQKYTAESNMATTLVKKIKLVKCFMLEEFLDDPTSESESDDDDNHTTALILSSLPFVVRENHVRVENYVQSVIANYSAEDFRRIYRLTDQCFKELCRVLSACPEMQVRSPQFGGPERVSFEKTVLIALRYLGHTGNIRLISDIFNVSNSTVITCRDRVIYALASIKDEYICWPLDAASQANVSQKFEDKKGFPGVIGAIDGTHIRINAPKEHGQSYVNRKNYHSIILQAVCLPNMKFSHIYSGWPGSVHDSRVLKNSELWENGEVACQSNHILGDGAYPIKKWLLTPYRDTGNLNAEQRRFNYVHSSTRTVIERAFGILKGRFKKLQFIEVKKIQSACDVITACCVLQNFCIMFGDTGEDFIDDAQHQELNACNNQPLNDVDGLSKRDRIARSLM